MLLPLFLSRTSTRGVCGFLTASMLDAEENMNRAAQYGIIANVGRVEGDTPSNFT